MTTFVFPGQGSQHPGMGENLFDRFPDITLKADHILGYSIKTLCLQDPQQQLNQTQFTQPALYVVNALHYYKKIHDTHQAPTFVAGHSLGEYNALLAAEVFDFETGLKLVIKRGELMSQATGGGMAAIIGLSVSDIQSLLQQLQLTNITIANYNSPIQTILTGTKDQIERLQPLVEKNGLFRLLNVSGAFHSPYMFLASQQFAQFIDKFEFMPPKIPVIANVNARPYLISDIKVNLINQLSSPVQWQSTIEYLLSRGQTQFEEIGVGTVLTALINNIIINYKETVTVN